MIDSVQQMLEQRRAAIDSGKGIRKKSENGQDQNLF